MDMTLTGSIPKPQDERVWPLLLGKALGQSASGSLVVEANGEEVLRREGDAAGPHAQIALHRKRALLRTVLGGENGAALAYIDGDWSSADLVEACRYFARNPPGNFWGAVAAPSRWLDRFRHLRNSNTRRGSRRNIRFHYDLGNAFYRHWLDDSMAYSSGIWLDRGDSLEQAQVNKLERVVALSGARTGSKVLEIGCGWGAQASALADCGAQVKGITLSPSQLDYARKSIAMKGHGNAVQLELEDYRDQAGQYDAVISIEMAEAVGEANLPTYFETVRRNLKPGGLAVLQVITISEDRLDHYRRNPDFIQCHVFPGGFLPSKTLVSDQALKSRLRTVHVESFGNSYALTLSHWRRRFEAAWPEIARQGFDERFRRYWNYYLCYCEAGFLEHAIDVNLFVLAGD